MISLNLLFIVQKISACMAQVECDLRDDGHRDYRFKQQTKETGYVYKTKENHKGNQNSD
jgi:carbamate kinase